MVNMTRVRLWPWLWDDGMMGSGDHEMWEVVQQKRQTFMRTLISWCSGRRRSEERKRVRRKRKWWGEEGGRECWRYP